MRASSKMKKLLVLLFTIASFFMMRIAYAQETNPNVGSEVGNHGFRQIYYVDEKGEKMFITDGMFTSADPMREGDYVTYMSKIQGNWQIFLHHIPTDINTQLTVRGNNVNPKIENGLVVWEGWAPSVGPGQVGGTWQVFLYDGTGVRQLTAGDTSVYPDIEDGYIIMARRDSNGSWRSVLYSINDKTFAQVSIVQSAKHPKLQGKKIFHGNEEFPLITDDIYLLGFDRLPTAEPTPITEEDIVEEIVGPDAESLEEVAVPEIPVGTETIQSTSEDSLFEVGTDEADLTIPPDDQ